ncbi:hypothetical protein HK097_003700, partial [Rhizophlyctis rosea]
RRAADPQEEQEEHRELGNLMEEEGLLRGVKLGGCLIIIEHLSALKIETVD